ncbi:MAG: histidinol-phosphate transaminase [Candidatus Omnitrophica bacterium]|nr:histidinol-phosphate transaminase [Candidatus Omnitrophota bacterium]
MSIKKLVRKSILSVKPYKPGRPIEEVKREFGLTSVYKMASNENALGPSPKAVAAIKKGVLNIHRYPDGSCFYLKKALTKKFRLSPENLIIGNGSDEIIVLALRTFINEGDEAIIAEPTFLVYKIAAAIAGAKIVSVPLKAFHYDLEAMKKKITKRTKMIFIANPDNPTGSYVNRTEVEKFLKGLPKDIIVFFDEAYFEYVFARDYPNCMRYLGRGNVIVSRSFSKAYGLGGLRIGWGAASEEIIGYLNQVREPFNVNMLAQIAAAAALEDKNHVIRSKKLIKEGKKFLCSEFKKMKLFFVPSVTNFVLLNAGEKSVQIYDNLMRKGIIVREMSAWGLKNFIRVTIGTDNENRLLIKYLKKFI